MKVKFLPQEIELDIEPGQSVMELAHKNGIYIKSICGGLPSCSECRVRLVEGEENVFPPGSKELNLIGTGHFIDQRRLSCQIRCFGDVTVELSEQIEKEKKGPGRPQSYKGGEETIRTAVVGNLIEQDESVIKQVEENMASAPNKEKKKHFGRNRRRGNQNKSGHRSGGKPGGQSSAQASGKSQGNRSGFRGHKHRPKQ